jgi:hypothetical protein
MKISLLEKALQEENYELAALAIVYGMLKVKYERRKEQGRRPQREPKRLQARVLQPNPK